MPNAWSSLAEPSATSLNAHKYLFSVHWTSDVADFCRREAQLAASKTLVISRGAPPRRLWPRRREEGHITGAVKPADARAIRAPGYGARHL